MNYNNIRRATRRVKVGNTYIGGNSPLTVQSMTNRPADDYEGTLEQIKQLEAAGCDIVRLAVPTGECAGVIYRLKNEGGVKIPIVADIHFDYRIALECAAAGADKIRINPGNIGSDDRVKAVADACRNAGIPIRVGVNSGSLEKSLLEKYGSPTAEALAESALAQAEMLERYDFNDIVIAVKSSDVSLMIAANRLIAERTDCPIHIGVTEAGTPAIGMMKSAVGIGSLLCDGIGDTLRVSLTAEPVREIEAAKALLAAVGMADTGGINIVSCPTCGRTKVDLIGMASELERRALAGETHPSKRLKVAVMGCAVNGPGEAREADIGIAGGDGEVLLFRHGEICGKLPQDSAVERLIDEINRL